jgi:hypothetical protein
MVLTPVDVPMMVALRQRRSCRSPTSKLFGLIFLPILGLARKIPGAIFMFTS